MKFYKFMLLTLGAVFGVASAMADPIAQTPANTIYPSGAYPYAAAPAANPRAGAAMQSGGRGAGPTQPTGRTIAARGTSAQVAPTANPATATGRSVSMRGIAANTSRAVTARVGVVAAPGATGTSAQSANRVGMIASGMVVPRISSGMSASSLYSSLYPGATSNIIDPNTGLISADAYSNCLNSYYTCMDEICTARKPDQKRCACAGRVKTFADTETQLEAAKEDLIKISGELALFIAGKGQDVSAAFTLTDAEKVMNCASWHDMATNNPSGAADWCTNHGLSNVASSTGLNTTCNATTPPDYCTNFSSGGLTGMDWIATLNGSGSDIIASLQQYAATINSINTITTTNNNALLNSMQTVNQVLSQITGLSGTTVNLTQTTVDTLANTWGYDLFAYAHNNVCNRVLDSCFNGIYEACGSHKTSPDGTTAAGNGPFNYNTFITITNNDISFTTPSTAGGSANSASAACYGYTAGSDPYTNLRQPVADARRSVMQKYALDANADCDAYGDNLKAQVQNVQYQKIAATQALQQKRLQFQQDATAQTATDATNAKTNFSTCMSELLDCYESQDNNGAVPVWTTSRIQTYCAQISNSPHCYQPMICNPTNGVNAVIDKPDVTSGCANTQDPTTNTCRNIVSLAEILKNQTTMANGGTPSSGNSAQLREACIQQAMGITATTGDGFGIRGWKSAH